MVAYRARVITAKLKDRYERWERRQVASRFGSWSKRRRWVAFVLLPITSLLCCGGAVGLPVLWAVRETVQAGRGAPSPGAAADEYLMSLSYGNEEGLLPLLDDGRQDGLLDEWHSYREAMDATDPPPFRLDYGALDVGTADGDVTEVRADVQAVWWSTDANGRVGGYNSTPHAWLIETRNRDGWRVYRVSAPPWCGNGGYVTRCGREANSPAPALTEFPTASPSTDLLQNPREMLRCGKRDPFRELHSCGATSNGSD